MNIPEYFLTAVISVFTLQILIEKVRTVTFTSHFDANRELSNTFISASQHTMISGYYPATDLRDESEAPGIMIVDETGNLKIVYNNGITREYAEVSNEPVFNPLLN
jgi:hypothetical protein